MRKTMNKKQICNTLFWTILLLGCVGAYLSYHGKLEDAIQHVQNANILTLLLIPTICLMYYSAGRIWYPYLRKDGLKASTLSAIQYEINFVDTVLPFYNTQGTNYALTRLEKLGIRTSKAKSLFKLRYAISISTKWIEIGIVMVALSINRTEYVFLMWLSVAVWILTATIILGCCLVMYAFYERACVLKWLRSKGEMGNIVWKKLNELFEMLMLAFSNKGAFGEAFAYGMSYSLMEVLPFWVIAWSMGHPELLARIIIASGVAITIGVIIPTPMGIGGFDAVMILCLSNMGVDVALAAAVTIVTRTVVLAGTALTGLPFYHEGLRQINN